MLKDLKKENSGGGTPVTYAEEVKLSAGKNCMRIVDPDNDITFYESWILCDDGVKRSFIVHNSITGSNILGKIIGDVKFFNKGGILEKVKGDDNKGHFKWESAEDPEMIDLVRYNGDRVNDKSGWAAKQKFPFNVIDRSSTWCKDNKKTKVLKIGRKLAEKFVLLEESTGPMDQYDINIEKSGQGVTGTNYEPTVPTSFVQAKFPEVIFGPITDEEKSYELWPLETVVRTSSANYVLKYLKSHITRVGKIMKQDFISELEAQAENEKEAWEATKEANAAAAPKSDTFSDNEVPFVDAAAPSTAPSVTPSTRVPESTGPAQACPKCRTMNPENAEKCSNCQHVLLMACDACHKMISTSAEVCPYCKAVYKVG
jgi:RNA polymerase subunit RPABC4/transcription elongation factor Spt4